MSNAEGLTAEERAAMRDRTAEARKARRGKTNPATDLQEVLTKIAAMQPHDRVLAEQVHELVTSAAPELVPKTWYGMPAYTKNGKPIVFFQDAAKFRARYATLGFNESSALDDGAMWPTSYALTAIGDHEEQIIRALVKRAAG